jgi:hypothetical protein
MSNESQYLLLSRSTDWDRDLSAQEMQRIVNETIAWFERPRQQGKVKAAQPLYKEGKIFSGNKGRSVADGPLVESKEAVGGYLLLIARAWMRLSRLPSRGRCWNAVRASRSGRWLRSLRASGKSQEQSAHATA